MDEAAARRERPRVAFSDEGIILHSPSMAHPMTLRDAETLIADLQAVVQKVRTIALRFMKVEIADGGKSRRARRRC
jgi:hypothetical protein